MTHYCEIHQNTGKLQGNSLLNVLIVYLVFSYIHNYRSFLDIRLAKSEKSPQDWNQWVYVHQQVGKDNTYTQNCLTYTLIHNVGYSETNKWD